MPPSDVTGIEPIFISVKEAAVVLGVSTFTMYELTSGDDPEVKVKYKGTRKLVDVKSLREYAERLPTVAPKTITGEAS